MKCLSIHVPRVGDDIFGTAAAKNGSTFYPRPPRGGRPSALIRLTRLLIFLSTSPAWGTTEKELQQDKTAQTFYPRPPRGGRLVLQGGLDIIRELSIHVPRVGDDFLPFFRLATVTIFLSTSPAWGTTFRSRGLYAHPLSFYPRPPRGGRPVQQSLPCQPITFYPRPPRGGRRSIAFR